jgi:predicted nucleic acid-binding protein
LSARLVLDNSVSAAWCFSDESNSYTEGVFQSVEKDGSAVAPALWPIEVANALVVAERKKRITAAQREAFLKNLAGLDIEIEPMITHRVFAQGISLARTYRLSVYDATYLEIAIRQNLPIATQDEALIRAAKEVGVSLFRP